MMKRQQATMELYNKAGVNPMSGCLPMLSRCLYCWLFFSFLSYWVTSAGIPWPMTYPPMIHSFLEWEHPIDLSFLGNHIVFSACWWPHKRDLYVIIYADDRYGSALWQAWSICPFSWVYSCSFSSIHILRTKLLLFLINSSPSLSP